MIEINEALRHVLSKCRAVRPELRPVVESVGYALAENVIADVDSPPHHKSLVDGFAIRVADAGKVLKVQEQVVAGDVPSKNIQPGTASHIMTGVPIPEGTEAMVMVEHTEQQGDAVRMPTNVSTGQFIMRKATVFARGERVVSQGTLIRPIEVGLLCEVGHDQVQCISKPKVAVLPTGDELVPCAQLPGSGQIRNSNGPMLAARAAQTGCEVMTLEVGRDDERQLRRQISDGLEADILILSGGVSAGVHDLVPATLRSLGVEEVFHKVRLKPGKPLWFGWLEKDGRTTMVFGLPGNPVSSLVCFEIFVQPAIRVLSGLSPTVEMQPVRLAETFQQRGNRPTFHPCITHRDRGRTFVRPIKWHGSSDMLAISRANCLTYFMPGDHEYQPGDKLEAIPLP